MKEVYSVIKQVIMQTQTHHDTMVPEGIIILTNCVPAAMCAQEIIIRM